MLHLDEPIKVSFNLWGSLIHQKAHQQGAGVLLSGLGGDEVITYRGIAAYQKELWTKSKWKFLWDTMMSQSDQNHLRAGKKLVRFLIDQSKNKGSQVPLPAFLFDYLPLTEDYLGQNDLEKRWLKGKRNAYGSVFEQQMTKLGGTSLFDRLENGSLLLKQYKMEYRYPLLDVKLLEFCLVSFMRKKITIPTPFLTPTTG
jgi:asparagine synthetase B (glutamine-hydrolysing)